MRAGGQQTESGGWLVLTESTGEEPGPYVHSCGEPIMGVLRAHPIWDGPFPCSGHGQCEYEMVPYCPKCEDKPSFNGAPIEKAGGYPI